MICKYTTNDIRKGILESKRHCSVCFLTGSIMVTMIAYMTCSTTIEVAICCPSEERALRTRVYDIRQNLARCFIIVELNLIEKARGVSSWGD